MATKHYKYYPEEDNIPQVLAYGFRPFLLILPWYIVVNILLWSLVFGGVISFSIIKNPLNWHIYELLFGVGFGGILAFMITALPEMYPGVVPIVNKKLLTIVIVWALGRIGFWCIDFLGIEIVALLNLSLSFWLIGWIFKPVILDKLQRSSSIGYVIIVLTLLQTLFFASSLEWISFQPLTILILAISVFMILILLVLRRINMEIINEMLVHENYDDVFKARPYRYNLAIFCVAFFAVIEFFYPTNSLLAWLGIASGASILGILNDYNLEFESIVFKPFTIYLGTIFVFMALGYGLLGITSLLALPYQSDFRHFLTTGAFSLTFFMVMVIIAYVHTGREIVSKTWIATGFVLLLLATFIRAGAFLAQEYYTTMIISSSILYVLPFILYFFKTKAFLLSSRFDGIKG
ncbi:MAG: NnrS family protein [Arcobacteraceae bacterium]